MYYNVLDILAHILCIWEKKQIYDFNTTKRLYKHNHQNNNKNRRPKRTKTMCMKLVYEHESKVLYNFFYNDIYVFFLLLLLLCQRQHTDTNCTAAKRLICIHHVIPLLETDHRNTIYERITLNWCREERIKTETHNRATIWICSASCAHETIPSTVSKWREKKTPHFDRAA